MIRESIPDLRSLLKEHNTREIPRSMILDDIISHRLKDIEKSKECLPEDALLEKLPLRAPAQSLSSRLTSRDGADLKVIAEIKKASPSRGVIREDFDPATIARQYEAAGAAAISVITEPNYFQGGLDVMELVRPATSLPLLRKDFLVDPYQILEARYYGADAVLLIVRALSRSSLSALLTLTQSLGMEALVEVHDEQDLDLALVSGATLIGINNRDLGTFHTDLATSERLARKAPHHVVLVSESGIYDRDQIRRLRTAGIDAFLIGECLMRAPDPGLKLEELIRW